MTEFLIANMAPIMFAALVVFLLSGFPVAFSLAANGLMFGLVGIEGKTGTLSVSHHDREGTRLWQRDLEPVTRTT